MEISDGSTLALLPDHARDDVLPLRPHGPGRSPGATRRCGPSAPARVALTLVIATDLQLALALMVGAIGVLLTGVLTPDEAYRAVSWKTVLLLAALIPLGSPTSSGGTRAATGHGIAIEAIDEPMSNERVRKDTERMPRSTTMPKSQVSSPELSELSRIKAN